MISPASSASPSETSPPVGIKGVALKGTLDFLRARAGEDGVARALAALPEEIRAPLSKSILATSFYPLPWLVALQAETLRVAGLDSKEGLRLIGRFAAESAVTGVYRIFLKVGSPEFILGKSSRMFGNYFQGVGAEAFRMAELRPGFGRLELARYPGGHPDFCRRLDGYFERVLELSGAKEVRIHHSRCAFVPGGGDLCEWGAKWR